MRERIYQIIDVRDSTSLASQIYNVFNIIVILFSLTPLMSLNPGPFLIRIDLITVAIFMVEYLLGWMTADLKMNHRPKFQAFLIYPFTFMALIDLISILPSLTFFSYSWRLFRIIRLVRSLRVFRAFKFIRHSTSVSLFLRALKAERETLTLVFSLVFGYILVGSLLVFNIEPETFPTYMEALTWAVMSLTSTTYGEVFPTSTIGQMIGNISYLVGVGIIAIPTSVITASYVDELSKEREQKK